jgi:D-hexose-6-phosphate mutarotase
VEDREQVTFDGEVDRVYENTAGRELTLTNVGPRGLSIKTQNFQDTVKILEGMQASNAHV